MHSFRLILVVLAVLHSAVSVADERSERVIQFVLQDVQKYEQQFSRQPNPNPASVKRALKLLDLRRQSLDALPDHSSPEWVQADQRYNALVGALTTYLNPVSKSAGSTQDKQLPAAQPTINSAPKKPAAEMISHHRVQLKKLKRDMDSAADTLDRGGIKPFQDAAYVSKYEKLLGRFQQSLAKYSEFSGDPDVKAAAASLQKISKMLDFGKGQAQKDLAKLGDVQTKMKTADTQMHSLKLPPAPVLPLQKGQVKKWLLELASVQHKAQIAAKPLPLIRQKAYLPNNRFTVEQSAAYDMNDVDRILRGLNGVTSSSNEALKQFKAYLDVNMQHAGQTLDAIAGYDPEDAGNRNSWFLGKGRAETIIARLQEVETLYTEAATLSQLLGDAEVHAQRAALVAKVQQIQTDYMQKRKRALKLVRMPASVADAGELLKIARTTLANPKYGVGKIERMVVNADKAHRSKETSEEKYDDVDVSLGGTVTLTGTKTTYHYEWDQFQVATAEADGDRYYIFYNTLKYFTSGATTTPLNHWILSGRIQGNEIPKENISLSQ